MIERLGFSNGTSKGNDIEASIHIARYSLASQYCLGKNVLDIACGEGYGSWLMAEQWGAASVLGVDCSVDAVNLARSQFSSDRVTFLSNQAERLIELADYGPFDLIISVETLEHVHDVNSFLEGVSSLLADGGHFICSVPNDAWYYGACESGNVYHLRRYTLSDFQLLLAPYFGPCHFGVGTKALGFSNLPISTCDHAELSLVDQVKSIQALHSVLIQPAFPSSIDPTSVSYFYAITGRLDSKASAAVFPAALDRQLTVLPARPLSFVGTVRLCLIADRPGWAFENIAKTIAANLGEGCYVDIIYLIDYQDNASMYRELFSPGSYYDLIHFFWRPSLCDLFEPSVLYEAARGFADDERDRFFWKVAVCSKTTSVYDHLFLGPDLDSVRFRSALSFADRYTVCSAKLAEAYSELNYTKPPHDIITDGVDLSTFCPGSHDHLNSDVEREVVVGWAGNSSWAGPHVDHKGLKSVIIPAIDELKQRGHRVHGCYQDRELKWIDHQAMPDYYRKLDVYVCASLDEGTPNPVLEAMACGVPILSTDVGIVREVFGPLQSTFIVADRNHPDFIDKLERLISDQDLRRRLSEENLQSIQLWSSSIKSTEWMHFFSRAIDSHSIDGRAYEQWSLLRILFSCGRDNYAASSELARLRCIADKHGPRVDAAPPDSPSCRVLIGQAGVFLSRSIGFLARILRRLAMPSSRH